MMGTESIQPQVEGSGMKVYTKAAVIKLMNDKGLKTKKGNPVGAELFGRLANQVKAKRLTLTGKAHPIYYGQEDVDKIITLAASTQETASVVEVEESQVSEAPPWHAGGGRPKGGGKVKKGGKPRRSEEPADTVAAAS